MKNLILFTFLFLSTQLMAQIIPQPFSIIRGKGLGRTQLKIVKFEHPGIQRKLESIPEISFSTFEEANFEVKISKSFLGTPVFKMDESYSIRTTKDKLILEASNEFGALLGIETLKQFFLLEGGLPQGLLVKDRPRFPWRGLLIDVARNWISIETLKTQINLMAAVKLNVLHLHLSDDQSFRIESKTFPKLHQNNWDHKFYTQAEIKDLMSYANENGIRVVPEFDVPGHTTSIIAAYPELASVPGSLKPSQKYGPHDEAMNPISDTTYLFLEKLFTEMTALFPDEYFHVGGDEVTGKHWLANPEIVKYMQEHQIKNTTELQFQFTRKIEALILKLGKKMIAWDEVLKEKEALSSVAQIWRGPKFANQALEIKMPVIFSYGYYLDLQLSSERHYLIDPAKEMGKTVDPALLWGGEACMWSERITNESTTHRIWPRAMAVAERLWSPRSTLSVEDFYQRQGNLSAKLGLKDFDHDERITHESRLWGIPPETLTEFFNWLEPGKFYSQHRHRQITTQTEWTMWVDHMPSESLKATKLGWLYEKWIKTKNPLILKELEETIATWNELSLKVTSAKTLEFPEKVELLAIAKDLGSLSRMATDALSFLKSKEKPPSLWFQENQTKLGMLGQVRSGLRPGMIPLVEKMVFRVAQNSAQLY